MSARRLLVLLAASPALLTACDGSRCGEGTVEVDEVCVPAEENGTTPLECGPRTELVANECVPTGGLAGFTVSTEAVDCDVIVDGLVPVTVTVNGVDANGAGVSDFSGSVALVGIGGVTLSPATLSVVNGTGAAAVTVSGVSSAAEIAVFDASGSVSGRSPAFEVVAEQLGVASVLVPSPVRSGSTIEVSVELETNACRAPTNPSGTVTLSADGVELLPALLPLSGANPATGTLGVDGSSLTESTEVTLTAVAGLGRSASASFTVVPPLVFGGAVDAFSLDGESATVRWNEASGGSGGYTYTVFLSNAAGTPGDALSPVVAEGSTETTVSISDGADGDTFYFTVQATDSSGTGDANAVQVSVRKGPIVFVDRTNSGTADGGPGTPFITLAAALAALPSGGSAVIAAGTYPELPIDFASVTGVQLLGGFSGFVNESTTATDWSRGDAATVLGSSGSNAMTSPWLQLGPRAVLSQLSIGADIDSDETVIDAAGEVEVRNSTVASDGDGIRVSSAGRTTLSGSSVIGPASTLTCIRVAGGPLTVASSTIEGCDTGVDAVGLSATLLDSTLRSLATGVRMEDGSISMRQTSLSALALGLDTTNSTVTLGEVSMTDVRQVSESIGDGSVLVNTSTFRNVSAGFLGELTGGDPGRINFVNNRIETLGGDALRFVASSPGVFEVVIVNNVFAGVGASAVDLAISENENDRSSTVQLRDNSATGFSDAFRISASSAGGGEKSLEAMISRNTIVGSGTGSGIDVDLDSAGALEATISDNTVGGFQSIFGISVSGTSAAAQTGILARNRIETPTGLPSSGLRLLAVNADLADLGSWTVSDNVFAADANVEFGTGLDVSVVGGLSVEVENNEIVGESRLSQEGTGAATLTDNRFAGTDGQVAVLSTSGADDGGLTAPRMLTINGNTVRNDGLTVTLRSANDRGVMGTVVDNVLVREDRNAAAGLELTAENDGGSGDVIATVTGNRIDGTVTGTLIGSGETVSGSLQATLEDNEVNAGNGDGISIEAFAFDSDVTAMINGNTVNAGAAGIRVDLDQDASATTAAATVARNLLYADDGVVFSHSEADTGSVHEGAIRNNVILATSASPRAGVRVSASFTEGATSQIDVLHNTVTGDYDTGPVEIALTESGSTTINVLDNVIDYGGTGPAVRGDTAAIDPQRNLVPAGTGDADDIEGRAEFSNAVERFVFFAVVDPLNGEIEVFDGTLTAGDRVAIAGGTLTYTVTEANDTMAILRGDSLPASNDVLLGLVWSEANFTAATPDYSLVAGSAGTGAATDSGDVGAFGGTDPFRL